jgi:hypothetical protein
MSTKTKTVWCYYCSKEIQVEEHSSNFYSVCNECKEKGEVNPKASENGKLAIKGFQKKYGDNVKCAMDIPGVPEKVSKGLKEIFKDKDRKKEIIQQREDTYEKQTGFRHPTKNPEVLEQMQSTLNDRTGHKFALKNPETLERMGDKNFKNTGYRWNLANPEFRKQIDDEREDRTGFRHWTQSPEGKETLSKNWEENHKEQFLINMHIVIKELGFELLDEYQHSHFLHTWKCKECNNDFKISWNVIQQGYFCPFCYKRDGGVSIAEYEITNYILEITNNKYMITRNSNRIISPYQLDIYIEDLKLAIEYNGIFYHSFGEKSIHPIKKFKEMHINKTLMCEKLGIRLIHIFEDEWIFNKEIVKARIRQILNENNNTRIHARKCIIKEIEPKLKNEFLNTYHIQGEDKSTIKLGAFYNDELVSVMTFSHGNIAKGSKSIEGIWELNRFCSNYNYHIPGVASKLLTHFKRNYEWNKIYSYADRRWSQGHLYKMLGFDLDSISDCNYWYLKNYNRIHRFNLRKTKNDLNKIPEILLRISEGYRILWDCGNLKFTLNK